MLPGSLPQVPALDNTFGALLVGTFIGLMYVTELDKVSSVVH